VVAGSAPRVLGGKNAPVRLLGLMISIGIVDSLNPSTIGPALYLAHADHPRRRVVEFTAAVFTVYLAGGTLIALGPGQLIRSALPHGHATPRHIAEIVAGAILMAAAVIIWRSRDRIVRRGLPQARGRRSSILLGATITAVELPTAFPYFAAIAAIVGAGLDPGRSLGLLLIFNLCFILPLLGIVAILTVAGPRSERLLAVGRTFMERRWPHILAVLVMLVGLAAVLLGATGLAAQSTGKVGSFFCHLRHLLHLHCRP
jgi:cytochrome c biogenesis protein CcdA